MHDRQQQLSEHYSGYDENTRLDTRWGAIEEATTWKYIDMAVKMLSNAEDIGEPSQRSLAIMEIGAGTGRYSIELAAQGHNVTALDIVEENLDLLRARAAEQHVSLLAEWADALDLSRFADNSQDIVLCLGPLYHLYNENDVEQATSEASRICRPGGFVLFAYITQDSIMASYFLRHNCLGEGLRSGRIENGFRPRVHPDEMFVGAYIPEFLEKMSLGHPELELVANVATDGIAALLRDEMEALSDEDFEIWKEYHLSTCDKPELQGFSPHMLWVGRKST